MKKKVAVSKVVQPLSPEAMMLNGKLLQFGPDCNRHEVEVTVEEMASLASSGFSVEEVAVPLSRDKKRARKAVKQQVEKSQSAMKEDT